jgi:hypothetical protein
MNEINTPSDLAASSFGGNTNVIQNAIDTSSDLAAFPLMEFLMQIKLQMMHF